MSKENKDQKFELPVRMTTDTVAKIVSDAVTATPEAEKLAAKTGTEGAGKEAPARPKVSMNAYNGGVIKPWPFYGRPVVIDLAGVRPASDKIALLLDHNDRLIVGQSSKVTITKGAGGSIDVEGIVTGDLDNPDDPACKVVTHAKNGFEWKVSVGVAIERLEEIERDVSVEVNGTQFKGPGYVVRAGVLDEVSFLSIGADRSASAKVAASGVEGGFLPWVRACGFDELKLTAAQIASLRRMHGREQVGK